jgi:hypothetical protein
MMVINIIILERYDKNISLSLRKTRRYGGDL